MSMVAEDLPQPALAQQEEGTTDPVGAVGTASTLDQILSEEVDKAEEKTASLEVERATRTVLG
jgi:hypothetical protein